jgi:hypothetical protein
MVSVKHVIFMLECGMFENLDFWGEFEIFEILKFFEKF